jgi:hypothetical protein
MKLALQSLYWARRLGLEHPPESDRLLERRYEDCASVFIESLGAANWNMNSIGLERQYEEQFFSLYKILGDGQLEHEGE